MLDFNTIKRLKAPAPEAQPDGALRPGEPGVGHLLGPAVVGLAARRSLHVRDCDPVGFQWIVGDDRDNNVIVFMRTGEGGDPPIVVVANFTPVVREGYRFGVPKAGHWREILNSDAGIYGGSGVGNRGGVHTDAIGIHGYEQSLVVTAPPLGVVLFVAE